MPASPQMDMLTGREFRRLIARKGGLWSLPELERELTTTTKHWAKHPDFPEPAWKVGRTTMYAGWEVFVWLTNTGKPGMALRFKKELESLKRRKFDGTET